MSHEIKRTFSPFSESDSDETAFESGFLSRGHGKTWDDVLKDRFVVILGARGIGKTYEFRQQVTRPHSTGEPAFFVELNLLKNADDWKVALGHQLSAFESWKAGTGNAFIFLDAVDEVRLTSESDLTKSLYVVNYALSGQFTRVVLCISSRISDWNLTTVRDVVREQLRVLLPTSGGPPAGIDDTDSTTRHEQPTVAPCSVYKLDDLSSDAARHLALEFGAADAEKFWQQVNEGGYEFLARRPLDLKWLVASWNATRTLGTYSDLIESGVKNALVETNQKYVDARATLAPERLRAGVELLAAASTFSGIPHFYVPPGPTAEEVVVPADVLTDWQPRDCELLFGSALFDEATYGRVQFHNRAVREYLAAYWVKRQLDSGLPFKHAWALFAQAPYGEAVLIPSRRAVLCWLAALDARVRQRVIEVFPEMVMFEGDPQRWSCDDVVEAFEGFLKELKSGLRPNWWNEAAEYRRVARMIPPATLSSWLVKYRHNPILLPRLLTLVTFGRLSPCADQVYAIYKDTRAPSRLRHDALTTLAGIASSSQRNAITKDLVSGGLASNAFIAQGIEAVGLDHLSKQQLVRIFAHTSAEHEYGVGPMATMIKTSLLPHINFTEVTRLLGAVLQALPALDARKLIEGVGGGNGNRREGWMLLVLPDVLLRFLELVESMDGHAESLITEAALAVERLRDTTYANAEDFERLRTAISRFPDVRMGIALRIALAPDILHAMFSVTWGDGLVHITAADLDSVLLRANDLRLEPATRKVWFELALHLALRDLEPSRQQEVLSALTAGPETIERSKRIETVRLENAEVKTTYQRWQSDEAARKHKSLVAAEDNRRVLLNQLEDIRAGTAFSAIRWLVTQAAKGRYTRVDLQVVEQKFGPEILAAFTQGLALAWKHLDAPDSTKFLDNSVPWAGLVGIASANHAFATGLDVASLVPADVQKLVKLCVWELESLDPWFAQLIETHLPVAATALTPWFRFELRLPQNGPIQRTLEMVLRGPDRLKRTLLPLAIPFLKGGRIPNERIRHQLVQGLISIGAISPSLVGQLALQSLEKQLIQPSPPILEQLWFQDWCSSDFVAALEWLLAAGQKSTTTHEAIAALATSIFESNEALWNGLSGTKSVVNMLVALHRFLGRPGRRARGVATKPTPHSMALEVESRIPAVLSNLRGKYAHQALRDLAKEHSGTPLGARLRAWSLDHTSIEAEKSSAISASHVASIGEMYTRAPRTEVELCQQVIARLEDIAEAVASGRFSERGLFYPGIKEKHLQLWLAARLDDTPRRRFTTRFSVAREPNLADDKRTDIEVTSPAGKICIEIKPIDRKRRYSARSLVDTLKTQLVGQYLRGKNSHHGILVLFHLERKTWRVRGRAGRDFEELVRYLQQRASAIATHTEGVSKLEVLPIECAAA